MFGIDYVTGPPIADLKAAGVTFVCRYLSEVNSQTQIKLLTADEAKALSQVGIAIVSNYEWYANRALEGFAAGRQDAHIASAQHEACGGPADRPIYFSVDVDAAGSQVADYFRGVASVIGWSRTGAYGSYRVLQYLFDQGLIAWGWQTYAWSDGMWEERAQLQQYENGVTLAGASVDYNRSMRADFGQWTQGESMLTIDQVSSWFSANSDGSIWTCKQNGLLVGHGILNYYCQVGGGSRAPLFGLTLLGLPRTNEIGVSGHTGVVIQVFERGIVAYDPGHVLDTPPGSGDVYQMHIDMGDGSAQLLNLLGVAAPSVDVAAVVAALKTLQAYNDEAIQNALKTLGS